MKSTIKTIKGNELAFNSVFIHVPTVQDKWLAIQILEGLTGFPCDGRAKKNFDASPEESTTLNPYFQFDPIDKVWTAVSAGWTIDLRINYTLLDFITLVQSFVRVEQPIKVKLNNSLTAEVNSKEIRVGCQTFSLDVADELVKAVKKAKEIA